ncbi:TPA: tail fiber domain-containing protein [Bacillus cereus]|nr:tail fiber domain-containing protein [Bacillus cereus]
MRTPSGLLHVIDFKTSQIVSAIQTKDYWDDKRHWEIKNNIDTLEFKVFDNTECAATLIQQNLVLKEVRDGRIVPYVINNEAEKNSKDRTLTVRASGAWVQIAKDGIIKPQRIEGKTVNEFIDIALKDSKWQRGITDYSSFHTMTIDEFIDPLTFLKKIAALFELEIQYRVEVMGSKITGWYVDMIKKRGQETGKEVTLGKDLVGVRRIEHSRDICTALVGFVRGEGDKLITVESINKGLPYIVDNDAFQRWNQHGKHKFGFYTPETSNQDMTPERLMTLMKTELGKRVNSSVSYEVEAQSIGRIFGLAHELINEGDTIRIKDTGFMPKLYLEARVIAGDESFTDPTQDKYVFGDYREITDPNEELRKIYNRILSSLGSKQELIDQLDKLVKDANETASNAKKESEAAKTLAEKVQENLKNNTVDIIEAKNPPTTGLKPYKTLWRDISNGKPGILKIWTGAAWESVVPDVESVKKETLEQVNKDIESAKTELNQKVQSVEGKAQEIAGQIADVQKQVNDKVDQTGVYTKDEIKDGFIGKQIYETDKQGNIQNFKDINTFMGQTNEALTQKAENSELKKTNEGLTKLQTKTNEIETTANGTKQKLSELETTVNNTNVGVRNYVLDSDKFISPPNTVQNFKFVNDLKDLQAKQVTLSVYVEIKNAKTGVNPSNRIGFEPSIRYADNSIQHLGTWLRITDGMNFKGIISTTVFIKDIEILKTEQNAVYIQCGGDYVKVGRPKIEIGNKATDWTPAPEDQVTTTDFTKKTVEIETTIKGINTSVSNVQNEQGKLTERVTKSEQTADGFKRSIESLTKNDTEISNKLNTVSSTVEGNTRLITSVEKKVDVIDSDITNLMLGTKELVAPVNFKGGTVKLSQDKLNGNAVVDITGSWHGLAYRWKTLFDEGKVKVGDTITYSVCARLKDCPAGTTGRNSFYNQTDSVSNDVSTDWKRFDFTMLVKQEHLNDKENPSSQIRLEFDYSTLTNADKKATYQQSSPMISMTKKGYPWRPAPEDTQDSGTFTKVTTEIKEEAGKISEKLTSVEKNFNEQEIGVRNLISDTKYWETTQLSSNSAYGVFKNNLNQIFSELIGGTVTFSFDVKIITTDKTAGRVQFYGENGSPKYTFVRQIFTGITDKFQRVTYTTKIIEQPNNAGQARLEFWGIDAKTTKIIIQNFKLEKGNKATGWTPAPEDQVTIDEFTKKTTDIEKSVDGVKTTVTNVQNSQAGYEQRMTKVEQTASGLSTTVSNLNNIVSDQGKKLTEANTKLEQQATAIGAKVELKQVENYVAGFKIPELKQTVDKNKQDLLGELANKLATEQFNQKMTLIDNRFTINEQGINASAKKTEVYTKDQANGQFATSSYVRDMETRLQLTEKGVSISVKENDVIAAFNMSKENITLNANRINLVGFITANHIKGKVLEGVTLKTSGNRFVEINKQDMKIFDADTPRGYIGFMETNDGSIQPSLVLGSDNIKYRGTGSFYIYQVMPRINGVDQPSKAYAKFGISKGENAEGTNIWSNYIQMHNDGGHLSVYSDGQFRFQNLNNIIFESEGWAPGYGYFSVTTTEPHIFTNNAGQFTFKRKGSDYKIHFVNGATDHDLIMGNAMIRSSFVQGYNNGLQIKDMMGQGWKDIELRTLRAQENISATGQMWAKAFNPTSARNMKENIKDIPFSALEKIMNLAIKQYNFKDDMYDLYQMRVNKPEEQTEPYTTKEIETYFGMIADDTEDIFTDKEKRAINLYNTVSIFIAAFQQQYHEFNEEITTVKGENKQLKTQVATLISDVSTLTELVQNLIDKKPEQP